MNTVLRHILNNNAQRENASFSKYACLSDSAVRIYPGKEKTPDKNNIRSAFFHDADRIIHSQAYSRYIDKTQVFYLFENDHITHRVLHVQFVSKIARTIGRSLKLNEDLIEAISLGHDLGHVPYGHDGEKVLDKICRGNKIGYFCHNAQSVRFLMDIEKNGYGLNLTLQVLDGILSHNGEILGKRYEPDYHKKMPQFQREYANCFLKPGYSKKIFPMTMEGCVARISDIIAYIGRDIEDAITLKLIKRTDIPQGIRRRLGSYNNKIINALVMDLIKNSYDKPYLEFSKNIFGALKDLRDFNRQYIYFNPLIKTQTYKIENMFLKLFENYHHDMKHKSKNSFIYRYWLRMLPSYRRQTNHKRAVVDFLAGMTDNFFNNQFRDLFVPRSFGYIFNETDKTR